MDILIKYVCFSNYFWEICLIGFYYINLDYFIFMLCKILYLKGNNGNFYFIKYAY